MKDLESLSTVFSKYIYCLEKSDGNCNRCRAKIAHALIPWINQNKPIHFVLPAFPTKSANRNKTFSDLPDFGETLALKKLSTLIEDISQQYTSGAYLTICSDGHVFNDLVGVSDEAVNDYQQALYLCCQSLHLKHINFYDLSMAYPMHDIVSRRQALLKEHGESLVDVSKNILQDQNERLLFCGLHRFLYEDMLCKQNFKSKNQLRLDAKEKTYKTIQRSHAWSTLIKHVFPNAVRLSIHPHHCQSEKLPIQLVPGHNRWATPWHNVILKTQDQFKLVKQQEALQLGAKLVQHAEPWQQFYQLG